VIDWQKPTDSQTITADSHKLGVAISNLLNNAARYSKSGGTVRIGLMTKGQENQLTIADQGIGIATADMDKIFSKFFRAENARKIQPDGNGLGLFIAKNVIENHGGTIQVKSVLDAGSEFVVTLPSDPNQIPLFVSEQKK